MGMIKKALIYGSLLFLTSQFALAERYPIELEYSFLKECTEGKAEQEEYCFCALKEIEKAFTLERFISMYLKNQEEFQAKVVKTILPKCIHKYKY